MTDLMGVAISTTGHEHRLEGLAQCAQAWREALPLGSVILVTVDGSEDDALRAMKAVDGSAAKGHVGGNTYRVGQPDLEDPHQGRLGVAANKNTGIELLMGASVEHLFLCDDDTWPLYPPSLTKHTSLGWGHSMVCWGKSRLKQTTGGIAEWSWPRGVMLYAHRSVIERVGGMVEEFGPGGHEHVEWSQRICNAGLTPAPFISPASYATRGGMGARVLWHADDMRRPAESGSAWTERKERSTTVPTRDADESTRITRLLRAWRESTDYVDFTASGNGRGSATLVRDVPSQGAGGEK